MSVNEINDNETDTLKITNLQEIISKIQDYQNKNLFIISKEIFSLLESALSFLEDDNNQIEDTNKLIIIKYFKLLVINIPYNIAIIHQLKSMNNKKKFYQIIIKEILFSKNDNKEYSEELRELFFIILKKTSHNKNIYKEIFSYITNFLNSQNLNDNTKITFDKDVYYRILELIHIFYKAVDVESPCNFFYFNNDINGNITILNNKQNNLRLDENLYILLFVKLVDIKYLKALDNENIELNLVNFKFKDINILINICLKELPQKDNTINIIYDKFNLNKTNIILVKLKTDISIDVFINGKILEKKDNIITNDGKLNKSLHSIILFQNFIGQCSTIMLYKNNNDQDTNLFEFLLNKTQIENKYNQSLIDNSYEDGIYKEEIFISFIKAELSTLVAKENILDSHLIYNENLNPYLKKFISNNLISLYMPTRIFFNEKKIILKDSIHFFDAILVSSSKILNGVYFIEKEINNFRYQIGGINHLLPLVEIMVNNNKLLTKENLAMFMNIVIFLFSNHEYLINREKNSNFFYMLSYFLEKIPEIYFKEINANFKALSLQLSSLNVNDNPIFQQYSLQFFNYILMNSKILFKFSMNERELIFELITKSLNITNSIKIDIYNIINILLHYDKQRYKKYCCKEHAKLFNEKSDNDIMVPELKEQIKPIINIIDLLFKQFILEINKYEINDEKFIARNKLQTIFEILTFDVSPCLQESVLKLFFDYILKSDKKYFSYLNINDKIIKICLFLYKNSFYNIKKYLFDGFIMLISNNKYENNNMKRLLEKYVIFYYPLKETNNNKIKTTIEINKNKYSLITYNEEQKKLISAIDINTLNLLYDYILVRAIYYLKQKICIKINLNILISIISKLNSITIINKFFMQLKDILDYEEIYINNKFLHFVLEISYRAYLIKTYNKEFPEEFNGNNLSNEEENQKLLSNIISLSSDTLIKIFMKNIYKLDYLITWSKYYYQIRCEKNKFESIRKFILNTFLLPLIENLIVTNKTNDILYLYNIIFEFLTFYKTKVSVEGIIKDIENLYEQICPSFKYGFLSELTKANNDIEITLLSEKWIEYPKIKILYRYFENILGDQKKYGDEIDIFDSYIKNKNNVYVKELKMLFTYGRKKDLCNKGTELIFIIYHFYTLFLTVINDKIEFKEWLNDFRNFILLIIISSCTLSIGKNEWPKDASEYKNIQNIIKVILLSFFHFILNRIIEADQGLQKIQKNSENDTRKDHFESIKNYLINTLGFFLRVLNNIFRVVKTEKQKKENTGLMGIFSLSSLKNIVSGDNEGIHLSGSYLFMNELYENCIYEKETNNEGKTFINYNKKNFLDKLPEYTLNSINERNFESNKENIPLNETITKNFIDNEKIKKYINDFYEKNIKLLFPFIKYMPERQKLMNNIIPVYDNSFYVDFEGNDLILVPNYTIELKDDKINNDFVDINKEIVKSMRLYNIKRDFFTSDKIRRYRKIKKKLFSFNNIFSCEKYFYDKANYQIKYKLLNHMTNDYVRIFLTPIIDMDYYLPKFSKFEKNNLFRENSNNTKQINKITDLSISDKNIELLNNNISEEKLNGLFLIKEAEYKLIIDLDQNIEGTDEHYKLFKSFIKKKHDISNNDNLENSCLVKDRYHIRGFFYSNKNEIGFYSYDKLPQNNFKDYDTDRRSCFGSVFESQNKKYDNFYFNLAYNDITFIFKRRYYYKICAIEIFTLYNKSYLFKFDPKKFKNIYENIRRYFPNILDINIEYSKINSNIGFINLYSKNFNIHKKIYEKSFINLKNIYEHWRKWEISTMKLLMILNIYSNRSYNDINQYPVFPWILLDYTSENLTNPQKNQLRGLEIPMGMLDHNEDAQNRKNDYIAHWTIAENEEVKEDNYDRYGSHYSTALYVSYYLVRIFPFSNIRIELQGTSFDDPNRLFNSIGISFECASTQKSDVRELIPEFYCFPEMFYNYNNFNLGEIKIEHNQLKKVDNVEIPKWAKDSGYIFIKKHREFLESVEVSNNINQWINLIFGSKQKGNEAKKVHNLFNEQTYEDFETKYDNSNPDDQLYFCRIAEFGMSPNQIFKNDTKKREIDFKNKKQLFFNKELIFEDLHNSIIKEFPYRILYVNKEKRKKNIFIFNYNSINKYNRTIQEESNYNEDMKYLNGPDDNNSINYTIKKKSIAYCESINLFNPKYGVCNKESPIEIFDNGKLLVIGGFWNGNILIKKIEQDKDSKNNKNDQNLIINTTFEYSPVAKIIIDKSETFAICANKNGTLFIYLINPDSKTDWKLYKIINDNFCEITSMCINEQLNLFVTCSIDGYINLYTIPNFKLFNSFIIENKLIVDLVFISQSPLALFVFYIKKTKKILFYSINGQLLSEYDLQFELKENYVKIYSDYKFIDYLMIYNESNSCIELYNMVEFKLVANSPKIEENFIDFCLNDEMDHLLILAKDKDGNNYKVLLLNNKEAEINWE